MSDTTSRDHVYDVVVVGGGVAGVGVAIALKYAGIENFVVLERFVVGSSFLLWTEETRFITPSFPTNSIGMLDLNAIALGTSPAHLLESEHPTGRAYAVHLSTVAQYHQVPIREQTKVMRVTKEGDGFLVDTDGGMIRAKHVIWAAGEFQYPRFGGFEGSELCTHTATIASYAGLEGDEFVVIGGYESGIDAAYHLSKFGKTVHVFDKEQPWKSSSSDPSISLSTYSLERMRERSFVEGVTLHPHTPVVSVTRDGSIHEVTTHEGETFRTSAAPLLASGFTGSHKKVSHLFESRADGYPLLNSQDESTIASGMFLCGPAVRHDELVFCFIFKFRQRFAVVAKAIANSLGLPAPNLEAYRSWGMYLDDLSCCGEECVC